MADVHKGHDATRIKLFGKMINVQVIRELKEEPVCKSEVNNNNNNINIKNNNNDDDDQSLVNKRPDKIIPCPRCKSMDTKFCYFNNYNVNQPRHFCKGCQRYWTAGGALRNVPVGAGRRKAKPPCGHGVLGDSLYSDVSFYDDAGSTSGGQFGGMVEWHMAAAHGGFQHLFQSKRRRNDTGGF